MRFRFRLRFVHLEEAGDDLHSRELRIAALCPATASCIVIGGIGVGERGEGEEFGAVVVVAIFLFLLPPLHGFSPGLVVTA